MSVFTNFVIHKTNLMLKNNVLLSYFFFLSENQIEDTFIQNVAQFYLENLIHETLALIRLGFLKVVFSGGSI